jgi:hypothetical protein
MLNAVKEREKDAQMLGATREKLKSNEKARKVRRFRLTCFCYSLAGDLSGFLKQRQGKRLTRNKTPRKVRRSSPQKRNSELVITCHSGREK